MKFVLAERVDDVLSAALMPTPKPGKAGPSVDANI
jgi:hypothetical protein